jgi:multiple sugar transport system substrate-binding protein
VALTGAGAALAACAPAEPEVVKEIVKETVIVEGESVEVTREVEVVSEVEKVVTATPEMVEQVTIRFWNGDPADYQIGYNTLVDGFHAIQDAIMVDSVNIPENIDEKMLAAIAADDGPDCWMAAFNMSADTVAQGHIEVVDPYLEAHGIEPLELWFPKCSERVTYDGKMYGVPRDVGWGVWAYNVELFDEMGVPYPEIGWTQQDFIDTCIALTDKDKGTWGTQAQGGGALLWGTAGYTWNLGFKTMSEDSRNVQGYLDSENSIRCIQHILDLEVKYEAAPSGADMEALGGAAFNSGRVGLGDGGTWELDIQMARPFHWEFCEPPVSEWGNNERWTWGDAVPWAMWSGGKLKDQTFEFLKYISGPDGTKLTHRVGSWTSPCPSVWKDLESEMDPRMNWLLGQGELPTGRFPFDYRFFWNCVGGNYFDIWTRYVELEERPLDAIVQEQVELAQTCLDDEWANA